MAETQQTAHADTNGTKKAPMANETVLQISEIEADYSWNARDKSRATSTNDHATDDEDKETPGILGLAASMETKGQDTPVDVRPHPTKKGMYSLMTGFRRFTAVSKLMADKKSVMFLNPGFIKVKVHANISEAEALELNLRENLLRENLIGCDLAYGVKRLHKQDPARTAKAMAISLGKSQPYINTLINIADKADDKVFAKWRALQTRAVSVEDMKEISELPKDKQDAEFDKRAAAKEVSEKGPNAWIATACKNAAKIGFQLGELEREGFITFSKKAEMGPEENVRSFVKFKVKTGNGKKVKAATERKIAAALMAGILRGKEPPPEVTTEEEEEDDGEE